MKVLFLILLSVTAANAGMVETEDDLFLFLHDTPLDTCKIPPFSSPIPGEEQQWHLYLAMKCLENYYKYPY